MLIGTGRRDDRDKVAYGVVVGGGGATSENPSPRSSVGDSVTGAGSGEASREENDESDDTVNRRFRGVIVNAAN